MPLPALKEEDLKLLPDTQRAIMEEQHLRLPWILFQVYQESLQNGDSPEEAWEKAVALYLCQGARWDPLDYRPLTQRLEKIVQEAGKTSESSVLFSKLKEQLFSIFDWPAFWLAPAKGKLDLQRPLHPTIAFLLADWLIHKGGNPCQDN